MMSSTKQFHALPIRATVGFDASAVSHKLKRLLDSAIAVDTIHLRINAGVFS